MRYPHFVGTIHSFVNEFLALPWLRSKGRHVKIIDAEIALNDRWWRLPRGTRTYLEHKNGSPSSLTYTRSDFTGGGKDAYPADKGTYQNMVRACRESTEAGYYCFDEMFVWASELLDHFPDVAVAIRSRFPLLFVDEVQDNSELQSAFLHRVFMQGGGQVIRQRFGDSNQAIYHRPGATGASTDTFPSGEKADLPNSFRFGQGIAEVSAPLGVRPQALIGCGPTASRVKRVACENAIFLFDDASVLEVLPTYAKYLIETFPPDALSQGDFTAVAGVHRSDKVDHLPRFMGHYVPDYDPDASGRQSKPTSMVQFLSRARLELAESSNTHPIASRCAEGILHLARLVAEDIPFALRKSAHRYLLERLADHGARQRYSELLGHLIDCRCEISQSEWATDIAPAVLAIAEAVAGSSLLGRKAEEFVDWAEDQTNAEASLRPTNLFQYPANKPQVSIRLGSIHSVKGETHTATLVLESYQKAHHLKKLLPWLLGKRPKPGSDNCGEDAAIIERLKLHYVAMTRPSHLLCLAMPKSTFKAAQIDLMRKRKWRVIECEAP
jgi:superfamily I DNA/RNA helicase